jgi:probable rRNA maturation factor
VRIELRDLQTVKFSQAVAMQAAALAAETGGLACDRLSLVFVGDGRICDINSRFRALEGPTDVIAFDVEEEAGELVGEVIVSVETASRQAQAVGHSLDREIAWLVSHGVLHLAGMDDETEEDLERMLVVQRRVLADMVPKT